MQRISGHSHVKFAPRHGGSDPTRPEMPRRLRERYQNSHRAIARAIRHAQSAEMVREHMLDFHKTLRTPRKLDIQNSKGQKHSNSNIFPRSQQLFCRGLQSTVPATQSEKMSPEQSQPGTLRCRNSHGHLTREL